MRDVCILGRAQGSTAAKEKKLHATGCGNFMDGGVMPLKKSPSKEAFRANVKAEVKAGKPIKQAVAIAYATKRKAK